MFVTDKDLKRFAKKVIFFVDKQIKRKYKEVKVHACQPY